MSVARGAHRSSCDCGNIALFMNGRFGIHALFRPNVPKLRIVCRMHEVLRVGGGSREVTDEVQVLSVVGCDGEGLLHQAIRLVSVAIRSSV